MQIELDREKKKALIDSTATSMKRAAYAEQQP